MKLFTRKSYKNKEIGFDSAPKKSKWFDWHLYPEEPIKIESIVEMTVFVLIVIFCLFLYVRWNVVPNRSICINMDYIDNSWAYEYKDSTKVSVDSVMFAMASEIKVTIPMTMHDDLIKDTLPYQIYTYPIFADSSNSSVISMAFRIDSLMSKNIYLSVDKDSLLEQYINKNDLRKEFDAKLYNLFSPYTYHNRLDSIEKIFKDSFDIDSKKSNLLYVEIKNTRPYFSHIFDSIHKREDNNILSYNLERNSITSKVYFFNKKNNPSENIYETYEKSNVEGSGIRYTRQEKVIDAWFSILNPYQLFYGGLPLDTPSPLRLEDISQAYYNVNINTLTIDSVILNIDFIGAVEFSKMFPEPDVIGMSSIVFKDPAKIYKIRANGLQFHAKFIELENLQQIRVFSVTAIMSAFVIVFVVFSISAYFKLRNKIKQRKNNNNFYMYIFIVKALVIGLVLYPFVYWTTYSFFINSYKIGNLVALPVSILTLILWEKKLRRKLMSVIRIVSYHIVPIFYVFSLLFIMILGGFYLYKNYFIGLDELLKDRNYRQATRLCYYTIMSSDSITTNDLTNLRRVLLGPGGDLLDNSVSSNYLCKNSDSDFIVLKNNDTLLIYDSKMNISKRHVIPKFIDVDITDSYITAYSWGERTSYYIDKKRYNEAPVKINGFFLGKTNNGTVLISKRKEWNSKKRKDVDYLFYTNISNRNPKLEKVTSDESLHGDFEFAKDDYYLTFNKDKNTSYIYQRVDNKFVLKKIFKQGRDLNIFSARNNIYYSQYGTYYFQGFCDDYIYVDSLSNWDSSGNYVDLSPKADWNINNIEFLKSLLANNINCFKGFDSSYFYFYDEKNKELVWYKNDSGVVPQGKIEIENRPYSYINKNKAYFVCINYDSLYVYNTDGLLYSMKDSYGINFDMKNYSGYIVNSTDQNIVFYPITDINDSVVVEKKYSDDIWAKKEIIGSWYFVYDVHNKLIHVDNIEGLMSLINRNKYLTTNQKLKLLMKLGYISRK